MRCLHSHSAFFPYSEEPHRMGRKFIGTGLLHRDEDKRSCGDKVCRSPWGCSSFSPSNRSSFKCSPNSNRKDQIFAFELRLEVITTALTFPGVCIFIPFFDLQ